MPRFALLYPMKPGTGGAADPAFQMGGDPPPQAGGTKLRSTTVFRKGDTVVRVFEIDGTLEEAIEHLVRASALMNVGERLGPMLDTDIDLTTEDGLRRWFSEQMMEIITHREAPAGT
jgi:hypothetical protein